MKESFDDTTSYCRSLGHYVPFKYCRTVNSNLPCGRIKDCWFEKLDIDRYLADNYTETEIEQIFAPRPDKISSLIDLINRARESK